MSVAQLQKSIAELPAAQRQAVAKFVARIKRHTTPASGRRLAATMRAMDAGEKYSWAEVTRARAEGA
jgi:hypothetical protein